MDILKQFNLPSYLKGKSFSEASKCLADKFEGRNSPEDVATLNELQGRLKSAQEHVKAKHEKPNPQGMPQGQGQEMPQEMTSPQEAQPQEGSEYNFGGTLAKMFGAGAGNPEAEGFAGTQVGAGFQEGASSSQVAGSAMGIAGGAMALGDMANTAFGDTGIDTSGRTGPVEVGSAGAEIAGGAMKGAQAGMAFGPWGAAVGGVLGAGAGFLGNKNAKKDALDAKFNSAFAQHNNASGKYAKYGGQLGKKYETGGDLYDDEDKARDIDDEDYMNELTSFADSLSSSNNGSEYVKESQKITENNENLFRQSAEDDLNKSKVNPMENLRYAAPLMNIAQLASLKKPEDVNLGRIDSKYEKNYVDERSMQNMAKESALNARDALMSASGGSGGRASANLLASQTLANKGMSDAYFKSKEINAAEDKYAQEFDMKSNVRNLMQGNQETAYNLQRDAAYKENKSALMAAIGNDLGGIGQEELFKKYPEMMGLGYDSRGNAVGREESDYDESFATNKTSGEEKKKAEASLGEDSKANNFRTKPSERQGVSFEDVDVDEVNPSATSAATSAEGTNNTPSAGTKGTISEQQVKKAEEIKRVAPQIYAPGIMELPIAGSYPRKATKDEEAKIKSAEVYQNAAQPYVPPASNILPENMPIIDNSVKGLGTKIDVVYGANGNKGAYVDEDVAPQVSRAEEMISDMGIKLKIDDSGKMKKGHIKLYQPEKSYNKTDLGIVEGFLKHEGFVQDKTDRSVFKLDDKSVKLSSIKGWGDGGNISDPRIDKSISGSVQKMFNENKDLVVTGATRGYKLNQKLKSQGKAVKNSRHLDGKALDLRINPSSERFMKKVNSDKKYKDSLGIEDVIKHHNHIHVEWK